MSTTKHFASLQRAAVQGLATLFMVSLILFDMTGCSHRKAKLTIGAVLPLTGDVASYGKDSRDGIEMAVAGYNARDAEYAWELALEDSRGDAQTAVTGAQRLLATNDPVGVIGDNTSSATLSIVPLFDRAKTVLISPTASSPKLSGVSPYFFRVFPSDDEEGAFIAQVIGTQVPHASVCILYVNNDYGVGLKSVFEREAVRHGLTVLQSFGYEKANPDARGILSVVRHLNPDAIYLASYYLDGAKLLKQARELGLTTRIFGATAIEDPQLLAIAGEAAEGMQFPVATGFDSSSASPKVRSFVRAFDSTYHRSPGLLSALGYDCANILLNAYHATGGDRTKLREAVAGLKNFEGVSGLMSFDSLGNVHKPIRLKRVSGGRFEFEDGPKPGL